MNLENLIYISSGDRGSARPIWNKGSIPFVAIPYVGTDPPRIRVFQEKENIMTDLPLDQFEFLMEVAHETELGIIEDDFRIKAKKRAEKLRAKLAKQSA